MVEEDEFRLVGRRDKGLSNLDDVSVTRDGDYLELVVITIQGSLIVVMPCDKNGQPVKDEKRYRNISIPSLFSAH